ncbi:carbon-nitrogen family hydrolase [Streptomyces sp. SHP 1-2]|uniref:carbon-nitrogen family hydrolase n=1 Tax=Streptomyces sp. SHP 1-2 TaxID=2769489 RepID=UPI0022378546|nr:carbon-nitrogen family hydrolase [Streptomyces sp. SHP 1-2]MCW5253013.1 carbon-nitrogen family hydrolase [Streptomyces sp. SHP 1-2]
MRVALLQIASPPEEAMADRVGRVGGMVGAAASDGAELIVLPELWAPGYFAFDQYAARAETLSDGGTVSAMSGWARSLRVHLLGGSVLERGAAGAIHNTAVLFDPEGTLVHAYRKTHMYGYQSREAELLTPGREMTSVRTDFGVVGSATCYDVRFPEVFRNLLDQGTQTALVPAAWPVDRIAHWRLLTSARAVENQMYVLACNAAGEQGSVELGGHSRVVGPWGEVLAEADGADEQVVSADIDLAAVDEARASFPVTRDRGVGVGRPGSGSGSSAPSAAGSSRPRQRSL